MGVAEVVHYREVKPGIAIGINCFGRLVADMTDGTTIPVTCTHGNCQGLWLCPGCALVLLDEEAELEALLSLAEGHLA